MTQRSSAVDTSPSHDSLLETLLTNRGITTREDIDSFLNPNYEMHTHDPFLLADMERAVSRIVEAVERNERIAIWSDYDTDGIPGAVILHDFFKKIGYHNFENYIPHRTLEGFGLKTEGIGMLKERGVSLIVTIDCGSTDVLPVAYANEQGIDVIITDHHLPHGTIPEAFALINPKRDDCQYPEKMLCGSGVVFKLIQALIRSGAFSTPPGFEKWLLDMVGIATLSDMVPLRGENRVFAWYGLVVLRKSRRVGLQALLKKLRIDQRTLSEDDIGFMIAPRINAASRMGVPLDAFRLLATDDPQEAEVLATHLDRINNERKGYVAAMVKEAKHRLAEIASDAPVIVIGSVAWKPSLLGLVASALVESCDKPVFVWGREDGATIKGSCRSNGQINVVHLMERSRELFIDAGGHAMAGGFSIETEKLPLLERALSEAYPLLLQEETLPSMTAFEANLTVDSISDSLARSLTTLAPFGEGNPKPIFLFKGASVKTVRQFGKEGNHLEILLLDSKGRAKKAIAFFARSDSFAYPLTPGGYADILASIERSSFAGKSELRLRLVNVVG